MTLQEWSDLRGRIIPRITFHGKDRSGNGTGNATREQLGWTRRIRVCGAADTRERIILAAPLSVHFCNVNFVIFAPTISLIQRSRQSRRAADAVKKMDLLLVEDDAELGQSLVEAFRQNGYRVELVRDGKTALARARDGDHRALIVDRMLPGLDGLSLVRALRGDKSTPVIFLTTMSGIDDRVQGLEAGGDDYLVKPFAFPELLARVRALTRRAEKETVLVVGSIEIDMLKRTVKRGGIVIELVPQEFRLLEFLAQNANRPVTRRMLLERVWDVHFDPHTNVVESQVSRLRSRLNDGFAINAIETVRGVGYKLVAPN